MRYQEFPPPTAIRDVVRCAWVFEAAASRHAQPERIVPDGRCELVVHVGDVFVESIGDGRETMQPRALFAGQLSRPLWLRSTGRAHVVGLRFHPASARRFLGMPLLAATDRRLSVEELWALPTRALLDEITARVADDAAGDAALIDVVAQFAAARVAENGEQDDVPVAECAAWLEREQGRMAIDDLIAKSGLGRRQLERRFRDAVGLSPRLFANVLRLRSVFDALEANPAAGWTDAALAAGYFDHSHLIRDFRRFVGCTPAQFVASHPGLATALVEIPA